MTMATSTIKIWGLYHGNVEQIDEASSWQEARYLVREYRMAFGSEWSVWAGSRRNQIRS